MKVKTALKTGALTCIIVFFGFEIITVHRRVIDIRKSFRQRLKKYKRRESANLFVINKALVNRFSFPKELKDVPFADEKLVLGVKNIEIRNVFAPYNPAIIKNENGYSLFFRYDKILQMYSGAFNSYIGCARLDKNFRQTDDEFVTLNTGTKHAEDPRIIQSADQHYLIYNDVYNKSKQIIHLANLDMGSHQLKTIIPLDLNLNAIEKNWVPFSHSSDGKKEDLYFEYCVSHPRLIVKVGEDNAPAIFAKSSGLESDWNSKWGQPLGGTQAQLVDGQYLAFFHSKFADKLGILWYVMGAYTFEATPPFALTAISPHPIMFQGIYDSSHMNTADPHKCVIFPTGYVLEGAPEQDLIHLACGENDSACKIVTFDKKELLKSLQKISPK